jgi:hypothetical protein
VTNDVSLSDEDRRLLRSVEALLRGVLAALPRPEPRGEWGRPLAPPLEQRPQRRIPIVVAPPAAPERDDETPGPPVSAKRAGSTGKHRRRHTPESLAADAARLRKWIAQTGLSDNAFARECDVNAGLLYRIQKAQEGMSENLEERLRAGVARLLNEGKRGAR